MLFIRKRSPQTPSQLSSFGVQVTVSEKKRSRMPAQETHLSRAPASLDTGADPLLRLVLEATSTGLWTWDACSDLVRWSPETYRIHGLEPGEFDGTGEAFFRMVHPDDRARVQQAVLSAVRERRPYSAEFRIVRPDGSIRRVTNRGRASYDPEGTWTAVLGTITDVTDYASNSLDPVDAATRTFHSAFGTTDEAVAESLSWNERALEQVRARARVESQARTFQALIENNPFGLYVVDADFRLAYVSKGSLKVFENVRPLIGRDFADVLRTIWPEPAATGFIERFRHTLATGEPYEAPATVERREDIGATEAYDWRIERIDLPGGRQGVECYFYDLSERQQYEAKLRESESTLRLALDAAGMSLWRADLRAGQFEPSPGAAGLHREDGSRSWTLALWDSRVRALWGVAPDVPITYDMLMAGVHPDDRDMVQRCFDAALDPDGEGRYEAEHRVRNSVDGVERWICATGRVTFDDRTAVRLIGTVQDITVKKEAQARLVLADRQKDVFLATLSHELRNPLAPIRAAAHVLANGKLQPEQISWAQSLIQRQVAHMARLLDDLMDVSRITQGKLALKREPVSLASTVKAAVETAQPLMDRNRHRLSVTLPDADLMLDADPVRVSQILANLLTNAAKYTDPGGQIDLVACRSGADVAIEVCDNGIGLAPEALTTLFEMFSQAEGTHARAEGGLGIGLALVKRLVELHGGAIHARSDGPGSGSTFTVRLPLASRDDHAAMSEGVRTPTGRVRRVLIADDNRDGADALAMALELAGHEVRVAYDGCAALVLTQEFRPDVALLDVAMPGMDGHALARALRAEPWGGDMLLCALTGWGQDRDRALALGAGFDRHFTKPIDVDALAALLVAGRQPDAMPAGIVERHSDP